MRRDEPTPPGLDLFWEEAHIEDCADHPLERELQYQLDALSRCSRMIAEATDGPYDDSLHDLRKQQAARERLAARLTFALERLRSRRDGRSSSEGRGSSEGRASSSEGRFSHNEGRGSHGEERASSAAGRRGVSDHHRR